MKRFKVIDSWISIILIPVFLIVGFITMSTKALPGYFIVGGWQIISMIIHSVNRWFTEHGEQRSRYHKIILVLALVVTGLIGLSQLNEFFLVPLLFIMFLLLILSPVMAIYYTYICYEETYVRMKRPMELLK